MTKNLVRDLAYALWDRNEIIKLVNESRPEDRVRALESFDLVVEDKAIKCGDPACRQRRDDREIVDSVAELDTAACTMMPEFRRVLVAVMGSVERSSAPDVRVKCKECAGENAAWLIRASARAALYVPTDG
mmetsp:Transcript_20067/g.63089  ORF Transcript_20067/g.63089 Transcript_20067/m.63089 type:complete len:131 (+) Transcript_20067:72-464(+)